MTAGDLEELFTRFRAHGDLDALAQVFDRSAPRLLAIARHLVSAEATAEDLVQATFVAAIESAQKFDGSSDLEAWLVGILSNKARQAHARGARMPDPERLARTPVVDPAEHVELAEFVAALERALARVPEAYRAVLREHLAEGRAPEEIARRLDRPPSTVRVQLHRGLDHLRRLLPAGFALGGVAIVGAPRGLASVRATVLLSAKDYVPMAATGTSVATVVGGLAMKKVITIAAVGLLALLLGLALTRERGSLSSAPASAAVETAVICDPPAVAELQVPAPPVVEPPAPRAPAAVGEPYGALDIVATYHDGQPVAQAWIAASCMDELSPRQVQIDGETDAQGRWHVERIHAGRVVVSLAFVRGNFDAEVRSGKTTELAVRVPRNLDVSGRTLDPEGVPIAGAELCVGDTTQRRGLMRVGASDLEGRYALRSIDPNFRIAASARGFEMSDVLAIAPSHPSGDECALDLTLRRDGTRLSVAVLRLSGEPLTDEWVEVVPQARGAGARGDDGAAGVWGRTDARGEVSFDGLPPGRAEVLLSPKDGACAQESVELRRDEPARVIVHVPRGAVLHGRIHRSDGTPWPNAIIALDFSDASRSERNVDDVCFRFARADAGGHYRFGPIPSGRRTFVAAASNARDERNVARELCTLDVAEGAELEHDFVIDDAHVIRGRLVDENGQPAVDWSVTAAIADGPSGLRLVKSDAQGRFELRPCVVAPHTLYASLRDGPPTAAVSVAGVLPDEPEREIRVPSIDAYSCFVKGRIVDARGDPSAALDVELVVGDRAESRARTDAGGAFRLGPVRPGRYEIAVILPSLVIWHLDPQIELAQGATRELGDVRLPASGTFTLRARTLDGKQLETGLVRLVNADGKPYGLELESDGRAHSKALPVGTYRLRGAFPGACLPERDVEIVADQCTTLDLTCMPGVLKLLTFRLPEAAPLPTRLRATVRRDDEVVCTHDGGPGVSGSTPTFVMFVALPVGRYTWSASAEGWSGEGSFQVLEEKQTIELTLTRR